MVFILISLYSFLGGFFGVLFTRYLDNKIIKRKCYQISKLNEKKLENYFERY